MPQLTEESTILERIRDAKATKEIKDYMYAMRRFVAGDYQGAMYGRSTLLQNTDSARVYKSNPMWPDFRIGSHQEGVSNHTLTWVLTLIKQTLITKPQFDFKAIGVKTSQAREQILLDRLKRSGWKAQQVLALMSYLEDGLGFVRHGTRKGYSCVRYVDTLDMYWDLHAATPHDFRFLAADLRINEMMAESLFGKEVVDSYFKKSEDNSAKKGERVLKVIEYWDENTRAYLTGGDSKILKRDANLFGEVPYSILCGPILPSMRNPLPHIISVIGSQTAHTELQKSLLELERGTRPIYLIDENKFTPESIAMFYDHDGAYGGNPAVLKWNPAVGPSDKREAIKIVYVENLPETLLKVKNSLESEIIRALGVNPFAGGAPLDVDLATEVNEISSQSSLTYSFIREDLSELMSNIGRLMCKVARFDVAPCSLKFEGTVVQFNGDDGYPIAPIMKDDVECIATAGVYETEQMKILKAEKFLDTLTKTQAGAQYPRLFKEAIEQLAAAYGVRDVAGSMQPLDEDEQKLELVKGIPIEVLQQSLQMTAQIMQQQGAN